MEQPQQQQCKNPSSSAVSATVMRKRRRNARLSHPCAHTADTTADNSSPRGVGSVTANPNTSKPPQNACSKISVIVQKVLIPLVSAPIGECVSFQLPDHHEAMDKQYLEHLSENDPSSMKDKESFLQRMSMLYDENVNSNDGMAAT
jgi:hypothetical protein